MRRVTRHINPATILALMALVFAATGGAYAAGSNGGSSSPTHVTLKATAAKAKLTATAAKAKAKPKAKPGPRGPAGPAGKNGTNGSNGTSGAQGSAGPAGPTGPAGPAGTAGSTGEKGVQGEAGKQGEPGAEGSPWAAGGTLPEGQTETGTWVTPIFDVESFVPISFPIPLAEELDESHVVMVNKPGVSVPAECENGATPASVSHPEAKPGYLCVFKGYFETESETRLEGAYKTISGTPKGALTTGAEVVIDSESAAPTNHGGGTWAVTAPVGH